LMLGNNDRSEGVALVEKKVGERVLEGKFSEGRLLRETLPPRQWPKSEVPCGISVRLPKEGEEKKKLEPPSGRQKILEKDAARGENTRAVDFFLGKRADRLGLGHKPKKKSRFGGRMQGKRRSVGGRKVPQSKDQSLSDYLVRAVLLSQNHSKGDYTIAGGTRGIGGGVNREK